MSPTILRYRHTYQVGVILWFQVEHAISDLIAINKENWLHKLNIKHPSSFLSFCFLILDPLAHAGVVPMPNSRLTTWWLSMSHLLNRFLIKISPLFLFLIFLGPIFKKAFALELKTFLYLNRSYIISLAGLGTIT